MHVCFPYTSLMCTHVLSLHLRWLLLGFQREFEHSDALRLFEILSCDHLELISQQVERARYQERLARKYSIGETPKEKVELPKNPTKGYRFEIFYMSLFCDVARRQIEVRATGDQH